MITLPPKWEIEWAYVGLNEPNTMHIYADNIIQVNEWFNRISHGILEVRDCRIKRIKDDNQEITINRVSS